MSNTRVTSMVEWNKLNWRKLERVVFKLQKRIFRASQRGDIKAVRRLQKTLMHSRSAKCLAVRRVTQDNQGKKTAGIDGLKNLAPFVRLILVKSLKLGTKAAPTRRVWIPKPGTDEKRPLGIPTIHDRALQALVKSALEPEWEAKFEPNSYGFRPGRSAHDAVGAIFNAMRFKAKFVLDADIAKCFDKIDHKALLIKLNTFPTIRHQIKAWLKAGVMDEGKFASTNEGTPQGGVLSPLLANIALHGMENRIKQAFPIRWKKINGKKKEIPGAEFVRYADDFVILHENIEVIKECQQIITEWLSGLGLQLKPSKTRIIHTLERYENNEPGFDFLGFNFRQYKVGKNYSAKNTVGELLGFKTLIKPSKQKVKKHLTRLAGIVDNHKGATQQELILKLNPIIRGWSNYYATVVSKEIYQSIDHYVYQMLRAWSKRRHPKKSMKWIVNKYWQTIGSDQWKFATKEKELILVRHSETEIIRHVKVQKDKSPYDGDWVYWSQRLRNHPEVSQKCNKLLKKQKGRCLECGLYFKDGDLLEVDHITPRSRGGKDNYSNLQLLHRHCHDYKTARDNRRYV
jgi:RNA-directed DNA polymerase